MSGNFEGEPFRAAVEAGLDHFGGTPSGSIETETRAFWRMSAIGDATGRPEMAARYYRSGLTPAELLEDAATASALLAIAAGPRDEGSKA